MLRRSPMACSFKWCSLYPASRRRSVTERERALFPSRPVSQVNIVSGLKEPMPNRLTALSTCFIAALNPARPSATSSFAPDALFCAVTSLTIASVSMRSFAARLSAFSCERDRPVRIRLFKSAQNVAAWRGERSLSPMRGRVTSTMMF